MQTKRDLTLIILLMVNASIAAAAGSSALAQLFPPLIVAAVGLLSSMFSAATAVYVALTKELGQSTERVSDLRQPLP